MNALILLILRYGEAKYITACDDAPVVERMAAFKEADELLKEIVETLWGTSEGGNP